MWLLHSSLNSSSVFTSAETQGSACHFWTLSDTAWAQQQQLTDGDTWDGAWGHSEMSVCVTRMFWGQVVGRGLDHGGQSCLTFNELAVVLLLVRRAVHCAIPPTAVKQRILWGHWNRERHKVTLLCRHRLWMKILSSQFSDKGSLKSLTVF